jgi:hypothetical protein
MTQEPRKATDVLLDMEVNVRLLLDIVRSQDLNIKVLSNKLNDVIGRLDKQQATQPKITVEAIQRTPTPPTNFPPSFSQIPAGEPERNIPIESEANLPQENSPQGFRRSSRPETYVPDNTKMQVPPPRPPVQNTMQPPPGRSASDVLVPPGAVSKNGTKLPPMQSSLHTNSPAPIVPQNRGQVPTQQRCVDKTGKSIFLADVEITDMNTSQPFFKTRTNGTGKWMASLPVGNYRVAIRKMGSSIKDKIEAMQDIQVDGSQSPLELPMLVIK